MASEIGLTGRLATWRNNASPGLSSSVARNSSAGCVNKSAEWKQGGSATESPCVDLCQGVRGMETHLCYRNWRTLDEYL